MNIDHIKESARKGRLVQFSQDGSLWTEYTEPFTFWEGYAYRMGGVHKLKEIQDKLIDIGNELQVLIQREGWDELVGEAIDELEKVIATIGLESDSLP